ncbi:transposase [Larkinella bovis]|uniref:Transposase n=1 Tax=Larkinella bovis TaxID=683041 RepID=A0ABW0IFE7_9BACT
MKKNTFSEAKIVEILSLAGKSKSIDEICREHNISSATFYNWRQKYGSMDTDELRKLKALEAENARLKKMYAELSIDHQILKEGYELIKKL